MLAIEVDGISHDSEEAIDEDAERQSKLEEFGISFLRFDDRLVRNDIENVVSEIEGWIEDWEDNNPERNYPGRIKNK